MTQTDEEITEKKKLLMGSEQIQNLIPHRYPFLFVDGVTAIGEGSIEGFKLVSVNESYFQGHFPAFPIMPGVIIVEALAQLICIYQFSLDKNMEFGIFLGIENARFKSPVFPGVRLDLEAKMLWKKRDIGKVSTKASVEGKLVFSGDLLFCSATKKALQQSAQ